MRSAVDRDVILKTLRPGRPRPCPHLSAKITKQVDDQLEADQSETFNDSQDRVLSSLLSRRSVTTEDLTTLNATAHSTTAQSPLNTQSETGHHTIELDTGHPSFLGDLEDALSDTTRGYLNGLRTIRDNIIIGAENTARDVTTAKQHETDAEVQANAGRERDEELERMASRLNRARQPLIALQKAHRKHDLAIEMVEGEVPR